MNSVSDSTSCCRQLCGPHSKYDGRRATGLQFLLLKTRANSLLHCGDAFAQAGLVARGGVLVQGALLDGFVEHGNGGAIELFGGLLVALGDGFAELAECASEAGGVGAIAGGPAFGLAGAFQRRKMICHEWFVYLCVFNKI